MGEWWWSHRDEKGPDTTQPEGMRTVRDISRRSLYISITALRHCVLLCAGNTLAWVRRRPSRSVLLSFQSLTQRRSCLRPRCRVWPPRQEPSWEATAGRDVIPPVRRRETQRKKKLKITNWNHVSSSVRPSVPFFWAQHLRNALNFGAKQSKNIKTVNV